MVAPAGPCLQPHASLTDDDGCKQEEDLTDMKLEWLIQGPHAVACTCSPGVVREAGHQLEEQWRVCAVCCK